MKLYYQLKDLQNITGLCYRSLKKRIKKLLESKYKDVPSVISKIGRSYRIHYTAIIDFMPKNKRKNRKHEPELIQKNLKYSIILNPMSKYNDSMIFHEFISIVKKENPTVNLKYSVEDSYVKRGDNMHINILSDCPYLSKTSSFMNFTELFFGKTNIYTFEAKNPFAFEKYMEKAVITY